MFALLSRLALAAAISVSSIGLASGAQGLSNAQRQQAYAWAANNAEFVLYHEVAHLLIDQLNLPVLGREEDAADNMATWILLNQGTQEAEQTLRDAAHGWLLSGLAYGTNLDDTDYYDAHSLDRQRAFAIVCLMVGSNQAHFDTIANEYGIDQARQDSCYYDHETVDRSLTSLLAGERDAANRRGTSVEIIYQAATGRLQQAAEAFKASRIFESVAEELSERFQLSHRVTFRAQRCGEANAYYNPDLVEITFCYELMDEYINLIAPELPNMHIEQPPTTTTQGPTTVLQKRKQM